MPPAGAPLARSSGAWPFRESRLVCSPFCSALHSSLPFRLPVGGSPSLPARSVLLWPLLTSRSASPPGGRRPFRLEARSPQVRFRGFPCTAVGSTPHASSVLWSHELRGPLPARPDRGASYPPRAAVVLEDALPVRRLACSLPASFSAGLTAGPAYRLVALRFVWVAATCFPRDSHPSSTSMLGTQSKRRLG